MTRRIVEPFLAGALLASTSLLSAATPGIGVVLSSGSVTVDNSVVAGNATVFDGNTVQTGATASRLQLNNGKLVQLGSESTARVYSDHMILEKGFGQSSGSYGVEANSLKISGDSAKVAIYGKTVEVAALGAPVVVSTSTGVQVANLLPGKALAFTPQDAGAMAPTTLTGVVRNVGGAYMLTDTTSNTTVQLMGGGVEKYVKHLIKVTGTPGSGTAAAGATQIINVTNVEDQGKAKRDMGGPAAAAGSGGNASNGAVIVAGIAVAAGLAATAAVLATQSNNSSPITLSPE
jgi:hypothetical protein